MERNYATQMDAARRGIVTPELKKVAEKEYMAVEDLMPLVASGKVAIPANKLHTCIDPEGIGSMLRTKINVNLGVSKDCKDYDVEMQKVLSAVNMGAEAIMDLSSHGNTQPFRRKLTSECPAIIGTVPVYDSVIHYQRDLDTLTAKDFIDVIRLHAEDGVDFVTLHCGITRKTIDQIRKHKRKMNIVSRGGSLVFAWMCMTGEENPFYEYYDEILDICREYDVTISLGDACRPGCLADATDVCQIEELVRLGELTKRAWEKDVQVMVEGPGHVPMDQIAANMKVQQTICMGAPFYVLGPLVTDIAPGYDHITAAIGGAIAAMNGAAFLCYVTPAEHLALPNLDDVKQGIIASKIAAHAADIAKGVPHARDIDDKMGDARRVLDWEAGSYRADERGMVRGHQFNKVEMVQYTLPEDSDRAFEELVSCAEGLVKGLGFHFRTVKLAAGDCSASMARTYDIEIQIPSMNGYKEVSSVSNARDYQARRGAIRFKRDDSGRIEYCHTLNGSGLATSRILPALVEQNQNADGSVTVPEVLRKYVGTDRIG